MAIRGRLSRRRTRRGDAVMTSAAEIARALGAKANGHGWIARCPAHDDRRASLSIGEKNGTVLIHCHAGCDQETVIDPLKTRNLWPKPETKPKRKSAAKPEVVAKYVYHDEHEEPRYRVLRMSDKSFPQERYEKGRYIRGMDGVERL